MKNIIVILLLSTAGVLPQQLKPLSPYDWLTDDKINTKSKQEIPNHYVFEVKPSRLKTAVSRLVEASTYELDSAEVDFYLNPGSKKPAQDDLKPFLVRALFANETGKFLVWWFEDSHTLMILHPSLGTHFAPEFCPLVIYLKTKPKKVLIKIPGLR